MPRWRRWRGEPHRSAGSRRLTESGAAVVDFVLVIVILVPLVLGLIQVALVFHVRNTLTAAASDGARYAAALGRTPADGAWRTRAQITGVLAGRYAEQVAADFTTIDGVPVAEVRVVAHVPPLGLWGPAVEIAVAGHGVRETLP